MCVLAVIAKRVLFGVIMVCRVNFKIKLPVLVIKGTFVDFAVLVLVVDDIQRFRRALSSSQRHRL